MPTASSNTARESKTTHAETSFGFLRLWPSLAATLGGTLLALPFMLALALDGSLSHDEHQHIAAGVLFAREGSIPYRDFPYFHLPLLVYAYGWLFHWTDHYLLASRLLSAVCAALTAGVVFSSVWALFPARSLLQRMLIGITAVALLLSAPVVYGTAGHSWNQEPSVLLALLAFLAHCRAHFGSRRTLMLVISGLLLGFAISMRITLAPIFLPFAVILWSGEAALREKLNMLLIFSFACAFGMAPAAWAAWAAPEGFFFGNLEFPKLTVEYRLASGEPRTMTLPKKIRFFFKLVMRPNWAVFYGFLVVWLAAWLGLPATKRRWPRILPFLLLTLPFLLIGALAPSPVFDQYFYPLVPFLVLGIFALFAAVPSDLRRLRWMWATGAAVVLCSVALAAWKYDDVTKLFRKDKWYVTEMREAAVSLRQLVPKGRVLTLAPTLPLEAGLSIYPELSPGPFAWRVAPFVVPERRTHLRIVAPDDLEARLKNDPPAAILLGFDSRWEAPLEAFANAHNYRLKPFLKGKQLWLAPSTND